MSPFWGAMLGAICGTTIVCIVLLSGLLWGIDYIRNNPKPSEPIEQAPRFRQRTAESDPNRQARVTTARVRAIIYRRR